MTTKPEKKLTLRDKLSRLTYLQAVKLLGDNGKELIIQGGKYEIDIEQQVYFRGDLFQLKIPLDGQGNTANASITMMAEARNRLKWNCTHCNGPCEHVGAALSLILEEKMDCRSKATSQGRKIQTHCRKSQQGLGKLRAHQQSFR